VTFVLDASVIVKWLLQDPQREVDSDAATHPHCKREGAT
jgi:predicted nucleic acid-binding protein